MPDAAIGADVMVGFPGETDADFDQSRAFIERLPFTYLHVFTYSERPGTPAAEMADQVPMAVRKSRNRILRELAAKKNLEFRRRMIGKKLSVVTLEEPRAALSDNYHKVQLAEERASNQLVEIEVGGVSESGIREQTGALRLLANP
jgi:threonylcarbamoyladenosine tRNA methylthiotransferase MtaB